MKDAKHKNTQQNMNILKNETKVDTLQQQENKIEVEDKENAAESSVNIKIGGKNKFHREGQRKPPIPRQNRTLEENKTTSNIQGRARTPDRYEEEFNGVGEKKRP